ncbi:cytochrome o ubiquinol oxidase operon protein cyoD [Azospirillum lipoferum]|uniref:Cytochrome bo(3) ubiquinol oxidase subunit 4 n=1 Tax=Azospirillum lipoferum TaxID=193 RepID=A0A5A9GN33_AZOLI|nr:MULTISPECIES: cytochrome o ubiquinol oxidase subunit IV [Azospirillum]KAA0595831.1 cytochrome o ubiquinol oxidase subunit IV [Azospirillum lipoferum]MCP1611286.1 cytochrome o ubiquinol oxidase operon protein cyoD [Azospirillum lipoferum]MDW5537090.1 cytochrome o ubiquinol oxidase subunit IV [Azospirillum sp. NL1]
MSTHAHSDHHAHQGHGHDHGHGHGGHGHDDHGHPAGAHGTFGSYMIGFVLSVILTVIPFWLVMNGTLDNTTTTVVILALAVVQIIVHMIYFLHMNGRVEGGWSMLAMIFTIIVVVIMFAGSLWVMYHLNYNMMPGMSHDMSKMP